MGGRGKRWNVWVGENVEAGSSAPTVSHSVNDLLDVMHSSDEIEGNVGILGSSDVEPAFGGRI